MIKKILYILKYRKLSRFFVFFLSFSVTMHPISYTINLYLNSITHLIFLCEP